jgi:hypothetical protein
MEIPKDQVVQMLRDKGQDDVADHAAQRLPDQVDPTSTPNCSRTMAWTRVSSPAASVSSARALALGTGHPRPPRPAADPRSPRAAR